MVSYRASSGKCITGLKLHDGELKGARLKRLYSMIELMFIFNLIQFNSI